MYFELYISQLFILYNTRYVCCEVQFEIRVVRKLYNENKTQSNTSVSHSTTILHRGRGVLSSDKSLKASSNSSFLFGIKMAYLTVVYSK